MFCLYYFWCECFGVSVCFSWWFGLGWYWILGCRMFCFGNNCWLNLVLIWFVWLLYVCGNFWCGWWGDSWVCRCGDCFIMCVCWMMCCRVFWNGCWDVWVWCGRVVWDCWVWVRLIGVVGWVVCCWNCWCVGMLFLFCVCWYRVCWLFCWIFCWCCSGCLVVVWC